MSGAAQFSDYIRSLGFEPPAQLEPGRWVPFATKERRGDGAGRAKLFPDGRGGYVHDWRTGQSWTWQDELTKPATESERRAWREGIEKAEREAREDQERTEREASERARKVWANAQPAADSHPYLLRKAIRAHGLKLYRGPLALNGMRCEGALMVPYRDVSGELVTLEFISAEEERLERGDNKRFMKGCRRPGSYHTIGALGDVVCIVEGYATGASVFESTGYAVVIAGDAGNLPAVARSVRHKTPGARIVIAGDSDTNGTGQRKAEEAARAVAALVALPEAIGKDWNDIYCERGADAVRQGMEAARAPNNEQPSEAVPKRSKFADPEPGGPGDWPTPEPLPELPSVPPFSYDVLPGVLRAFVQDIAERMQCPPEFPAVGAVAMIGAAIGRRLGIRPKRYDSWTVVPNLWGMSVGKSGIMKSPAQADAIAPLKRMQAKAFEEYERAKSEYEISAKAEKIRGAHAESEARQALRKDRGANVNAMLRSDLEIEEPKPRRYVVNDSTPEALCETLKDNPHGVLCERDELIGLLRSMDKEGQQEARALYLTAADGDKSFTVDRIMRGAARHIEGVCVSIVGSIQPGVLASYVRETQRGLSGDDGLLQRFGLMVYPDIGREWRHVDRPENADAKSAVYGLVERLCNLTPAQVGAEPAPEGGIPYVRFGDAAQELFVEWLGDLEGKIRSGEDHPAIVSHLAKYRKVVPALALINHLSEGGSGPVSEGAIGRALLFVELLEAHARRVYSYAARPALDAAKTILAKLKAGKLAIEFTARDVYRQGWSGLTDTEETTTALRVLEDYGYLRSREGRGEAGGRPSTVYRAHPSSKGAP